MALGFVDRISFAVIEDGAVRTIALFGYPDQLTAQWVGRRTELDGANSASEAIASRELVVVRGGAEFDRRYPAFADLRDAVGDEATITAPITVDGDVVAVLHVTATTAGRLGPEEAETTRTLAALGRAGADASASDRAAAT